MHWGLTFSETREFRFLGLTAGFSVNSLSPTSQSGYGDFDYTIDCNKATPGCGPGASDPDLGPLQFDVTLTGAGTFQRLLISL